MKHILGLPKKPRSFDTSIQDFAERLQHADTLEEAWRQICIDYERHGIEFLIYMYMRPSAPNDHPLVLSSFPAWWVDYYADNEYARNDPFFITCHTFAPIRTGREYIKDHCNVLLPKQQHLINEAGETGAITGISSPVRLVNPGHFGGWNFLTRLRRAKFEAHISACSDRLQLMGFIAHESLQQFTPSRYHDNQIGALSNRERECLLWLARGLRSSDIAERLGIALVTVELHFRRARAKLAAATREEALAKAILSGEIVP